MAIEGYIRKTVKIEALNIHSPAEALVRAYAGSIFCAPYAAFDLDRLNIHSVPMQKPRPIETLTNINPEYLGDPTVRANPILQFTTKERL